MKLLPTPAIPIKAMFGFDFMNTPSNSILNSTIW